MSRKDVALLLLVTIGAVIVHGYHPAVEDGELYLPGIKRALNPMLYPFNDEFFMSHARLTLFDELVAASVRLTHLPFDYVISFWHFLCIFALLWGCWRVSRACFKAPRAQWGSVALVAALLTIPVAGTALYIMDQYLTPRDLSTAGIMLALADALEHRIWRAGIWIVLIATIHPLMSVFGIGLLILLYIEERRLAVPNAAPLGAGTTAAFLLPVLLSLQPVSSVYRGILDTSHAYFLVVRWEWYEWIGIFAPLALLWAIARYGQARGRLKMVALCRALVIFGVVSFAAALLVSIPRLAGLALLQPMRSLHLIFILLFVLLGGIIAESVLKSHAWRWVALLAPICLGVFVVQRQLFPATEHLELPGRSPRNSWVQAFDWIRKNTPNDAIFALDPNYMNLEGEDEHGFRELAERSALANFHDRGAVSMFPGLSRDWYEQDQAQQGWRTFQAPDFQRLRHEYGVTWVVLQRPGASSLVCPFHNGVVIVCQIP
jgi:hypothetical protein